MKLIKNKLSIFLLVVVLIAGFSVVGTNYASATGAASFAQATTVALDVGNFTITGGSDADSVTTSNTQVSVTISSGETFTLESTNRYLLVNDGGYTYECLSDKSTLTLTSATSKTVIITPSSNACGGGTGGGGGGGSGGSGASSSSTPTPSASPAVSATPTSSPAPSSSSGRATPASKGFVNLSAVSLKDGDVISAAGSADPDIYIVNPNGYKRLFLNPAIFGFYGHLGGFGKVKSTTSTTRDIFVTSGLFRNCETSDKKVYGVENTGEDTGMLHWVNTTGEQAVSDDPDFFKKVFCINTKEFNWYPKGSEYTSVNQIPDYSRKSVPSAASSAAKKYKVVNSDFLNVRVSASTTSAILGKLLKGDIIESLGLSGLWHKIKYQNKDAWVHGDYLKAI